MSYNMNSKPSGETKGNILVVDDQLDNLRLLFTMLTEQGYKVRKVTNGHLALDTAQVHPPDLILLDIMMPEIDGFEVCSLLKADERTREIPIIFLSALNETRDKVKAFKTGGVDYISKPFRFEEVLVRIENQLSMRQLSLQMKEQNQKLQQQIRDRICAEVALQNLNRELEIRSAARAAELRVAHEQLLESEAKLLRALAQEKELNQFKSRLIAILSHKYRTPLTTISSSAEILKKYRDRFTPEKQLKHLQRIQGSVKYLTSLVNELLFLDQAELENITLNPVPLDLVEFCSERVEELQLTDGDRHVIQFTHQGHCTQGEWDERVLEQILTILVTNAIDYSPNGGVIDFQLSCQDDAVTWQIKDQGIGIPKENQARLFESFYRASNVGIIQGTGLGLAIVKKRVDLYKGKISFHSEVGVGTTFTINLPLAKTNPPPHQPIMNYEL